MEISFQLFLILIAFSLCLHLNIGSVRSLCLEDQHSSLLKLKQTLIFNHALSSKLVSWGNSSTDCCSWAGVTCSGGGHVIDLDLSHESISGGIDSSSSLFNLQHLQGLNLAWNLFSGSIPSSFSMLKNLTDLDLSNNILSGQISSIHWENLSCLVNLELSNNSLEGIIPLSLFSLPSLKNLYLQRNRFFGQIGDFPVVSSSQLVTLDLSSNRLEGSIPSSFFKLQGLQQLILSSNNFSGTLDLSIIQKLGNLFTLDLSFNHLSVEDGFGNINVTSFPSLQELRLVSCKLRKFPSFLRNQSFMSVLDLSDNQIEGEIPEWICDVPSRYLNLSHNLLTKIDGSCGRRLLNFLDLHSNLLRGDITNVTRAKFIDYSENQFNSVIPTDIDSFLGRNTVVFLASGNYLRGVISESICNMSYLQVVDLSRNFLNGTVPWCLVNMTQSGYLSVLNLRRNNLIGTIPDTFSGNCGLQTLNLNENSLQGKIPKSLANCKMLEVLDIGNNRISDSFPCWLSTISTLRILVLRSNKFYGSIECLMSNATMSLLQIVDVASNKFSGKLPKNFFESWTGMMVAKDEAPAQVIGQIYYKDTVTVTMKGLVMDLVKILTIFSSIDFSCNNFEGEIPEVMGEFQALIVLNLSHNSLIGPIPSSLGNLHNLESLDLSSNNLTGNIPQQLGGLNFLAVLNLSHNQLEGRIPKGNQLQTFSEDSFKDNKGLCGAPLIDCGPNKQPPPQGNNSNDGTNIEWNLISAEVGFVFGLAIVILPLMFMKRWRIWYYKRVDSVLFRIFPQLDQRSRNHGRRALRTR
ncbi:hypothetical protein SLE2022_105510 [Rubroshorea leprosula]